jgi:hypothetical protein
MVKRKTVRETVLSALLLSFIMSGPVHAAIPLPVGQQVFSMLPSGKPMIKSDPAAAHPVGIGPLSSGDNTLRLQIGFDEFEEAVDIIVGISVPAPVNDILILGPDLSVQSLSAGLIAWKSATKGPVNETIWGNIDISVLPEGDYTVYILVIPAGALSSPSVTAFRHGSDSPRLPTFYIYANPFIVVKSKVARLVYDLQCKTPDGSLAISEEGFVPFGIKQGNQVGGMGGGILTYTVAMPNSCVGSGTCDISMIFNGLVEEAPAGGYVLRMTGLHGQIDCNMGQATCPFLGTIPIDPYTLQIGTFLFPGLEDGIISLHLTPPYLGEKSVFFDLPPVSCSGEISVDTLVQNK